MKIRDNTRQAGIGLVEMMVVMLLGLVMLGGVGSLYLNFKKTYQIQKTQGELQDGFRYAGTLLTGILRQAGYASMQVNGTLLSNKADVFTVNSVGTGNFTAVNQVVHGQQGTLTNVPVYASDGSVSTLGSSPADRISIRFMGGTEIYRCLGGRANLTGAQYSATFRINSNYELECVDEVVAGAPTETETDQLLGETAGPANARTRMLGMTVWYGEDTNGDGSVDRYRRASSVSDWRRIISARIDFLVQAGLLAPKRISYHVNFPNSPAAG